MKVCFFGLGSIGKRHLINFTNLMKKNNEEIEVHALRSNKTNLEANLENLIDNQIFNIKDLDNDYDIAFITNPTYLHYNTINLMSDKSKNMFIEKPVFDKSNYKIEDIKLKKNGIYYVAAPLRYNKVIQYIKKIVEYENIYSIRSICSTYLPDWRPNIDYRKVYSSSKAKGGGVSIDCIHEWDYLIYLIGFPKKVVNFQGKFSDLEINSEDLSIYIGEYEDKLVELHLDYFGKKSKREIEIYTKDGCIIGDLINNKVSFTDEREEIQFEEYDKNYMYEEEMKYFFNLIQNNTNNENDINHAYKVLKMIKESI